MKNEIGQGTRVTPVSCEKFDFERYVDYEESLKERQKRFLEADEGILSVQTCPCRWRVL